MALSMINVERTNNRIRANKAMKMFLSKRVNTMTSTSRSRVVNRHSLRCKLCTATRHAFVMARHMLFLGLLGTGCIASALADYSQHPAAAPVIATLVEDHGMSRDEVMQILANASTEQRILDSMANAAEKTKTWTAYRSSFLTPVRIDGGVDFLREYAQILQQVEQEYGVPRQVIAAIVGVETNYGGYTGKANVLNALATLAFEHPRRTKFFSSELVEYIVLCTEQGWQADQQLGSYAGAMGMSQFMPSNYRKLAIDGDENGVADLHHPTDAIHSVANYLTHHGWQSGELVAARAAVNEGFDPVVIGRGLRPNFSLDELSSRGYHSQRAVEGATMARVVRFNDADGDEFWLGFNNFYVISRYNPRSKYALAVYLLSEEILRSAAAQNASS